MYFNITNSLIINAPLVLTIVAYMSLHYSQDKHIMVISEWFNFWSDRQCNIAQAYTLLNSMTPIETVEMSWDKNEVLYNNTLILYLWNEWWWFLICSLEVKVQVISFREDSPEDMCLFPGNYVCRLPLKETLFWRVEVVVNAIKVRSSIMVWIPVKERERERRESKRQRKREGVWGRRERELNVFITNFRQFLWF